MKYLTILIAMAPLVLAAQCDCPPLPDDQSGRTVVSVSTVLELQAALQACNRENGNYTILLEDGEYILTNNLLYIGSNMANLTIRSASGNRDAVVIKGQGYEGNVVYIFNVAADNFTAADMTIGWIGYHGIQIHAESDADSCLIQNVRFVNTKEQMLKVSGNSTPTYSDGGVVQCCLFEFPAGVAYQYYTGGIDAHRARDWEVRYNTFKHIRSPETQLSEHAIHFWSESENTLVENNLILDCDRGVGFGLGNSGHEGGMIRNNFIHTSRDVGIGLESSANTKVYHNTVVTDNYFNSIEYRFDRTSNVHIANNLTTENVASRNGGTGVLETNEMISDLGIFEDASNHDYHLAVNLPNITDAGTVLTDVQEDYDCHSRMADGMPDIGADEFDSVITSTDNSHDLHINIYPNPTSNKVFFSSPDGAVKYELINSQGQIIISQDLSTNQHNQIVEILLGRLPRGIYYLKVFSANRVSSAEVIKP
jgi:hypothetical protein